MKLQTIKAKKRLKNREKRLKEREKGNKYVYLTEF